MGDFDVHRLRIGDWVPCAIKSIAVDTHSSKIAVGRDNGDIEVCIACNRIGTPKEMYSHLHT